MENVNNTGKCSKVTISVLAIMGAFLLMAFLVRQMTKIAQPVPVGADRAAARAKDNAVIKAEGIAALESWGYVDQPRGIVRLPIEDAKKLTIQGYKDVAAFRADIMARSDKASAPPPKPVNPFE